LTPPQVAELLGISPEKVIFFIRRGELRGSNITADPAARPRFVVSMEALEAFLAARQPTPPAPRQRRRRKATEEVDYLADIS
ncbi:MAG: helix-turn-helix domain-containing protein, partial [Candidatus Saccharimonadales bacterium]